MSQRVMELQLSGHRTLFRDTVRDFVRAEIAPRASETEELGRTSREVLEAMGSLGLMGIPIPEKYGGAGADLLDYIIAMEEISSACASTALCLAAHTSLVTLPILAFGTEELKEKYLPDLATGRKLGAFCLTEPQSGSDAAALKTRVEKSGDGHVLEGSKVFITNGSFAEIFLVAARSGPGEGRHGVSAVLAEREFGGISVGRVEEKLGMRGSNTAEIFFQGCPVPGENILGTEGEGFSIFMETLDGGRIGIGSMGVGIGRASLECARDYARNREAFGKPLSRLGAIQEKIANMALGVHTGRLLVHHAARKYLAGSPYKLEAAMAKLYTSEMASRAAREAIQILGANGYSREFPVERYLRDAKLLEIGEGTSEIQRKVIAREVFEGAS